MSEESIKPSTASNKRLNPLLYFVGTKSRVKINGDCLKQEKFTFNHGKIINIYIVYEIEKLVNISSHLALANYLFSVVKLAKHVDIDQYEYSGFDIGFDRKGFLSISNEIGRDVIIFEVDMSFSTKIDNRKKYILVLSKGPTQGLGHIFSAEKLNSINFTKKITNFCLSLGYNGANSYLFVTGTEIIKFKSKERF